MSFSASRLTCFALLSALEQDLRGSILTFLVTEDYTAVLSEGQVERALSRRGRDVGSSAAKGLASLLPYLDFADGYEVLLANKDKLPGDLLDQLRAVQVDLERTTAVRNRVAHTRPMEVDDLANVLDLASRLCAGAAVGYWSETCGTLTRLTEDASYVLGLSIDLPAEPPRGPMHNLPVPDFDETGFFGRRSQVNRIKKIVNGAYPVVSVLGDGGIGKTSVALKVAYELLDDPKSRFDAIVWVSAKSAVLSANEIQRVNDAIEDSLGLFVKAAGVLAGQGVKADPIEEVLAYMENFRILLILDNLETVLDQRLREFLLELPLGSKVIVTSRIGLGVENPVQLEPLADDESHRLLRAVARIREVGALKTLPDEKMRALSQKMGGHPLYIKWFVSGVQAGRRPEELLLDNTLLLDYCMSNVYEYLSDAARVVLDCMQVLPGEKRQAEIAFLCDFDAQKAQAALLELLTTNFTHMEGHARTGGFETTYQLSEFARSYLDKQHPVDSAGRHHILERFNELRELGWRLQAENTASPYDPETVNIRDSGDFSTARFLRDAITAARVGHFVEASERVSEAQALSPMYAESWRVEALIQAKMLNMSAARTAFERAIELDSESPTLHYMYGNFLSDERLDSDGAVRHLRRAAQLDSDNAHVLSALSWALLEAGLLDEAAASALHVLRLGAPVADASFALTVGLRAYVYVMNAKISGGHIYQALESCEAATELACAASNDILGGEPADRLLQLRDQVTSLQSLLEVEDQYRISKTEEFVATLDGRLGSFDEGWAARKIGRVRSVLGEKLFGFIRSGGQSDEYFFHLSNMAQEAEWTYLANGSVVAFSPNDADPRGPRATDVRFLP